ncbi:MAG: ABC transporter ATP-binding protein/permease [Oscillospiraceae bacterium]|nr:ABC transporter ATP-binding protein/permease [Oscillospiraceae bacterium]
MKKSTRTLRNLLYLIKPYWSHGKLYLLGRLATPLLLAPALALVDVTLLQAVISAVSSGATLAQTLTTAAAYSAAWFGLQLLHWGFLLLYDRWKIVEVQAKIKRSIYAQAIATDYKYFDNPEFYNDFTFATRELTGQSEQALGLLGQFIGLVATSVTMIAYISRLGLWPVVIALAGSALGVFAQKGIGRLGIARAKEELPFERKMDYTHRVFYQQPFAADLKNPRLADALLSSFTRSGNGKIGVVKRYAKMNMLWSAVNLASQMLSQLGILTYLIFCAYRRGLGVGALAGLFAATLRLSGMLNQFADLSGQTMKTGLYAEKIRKFFALESTIEAQGGDTQKKPAPGAFALELRGAHFAYPHSDFALRDLNISVQPGEKIAIVGENGAGKSTLAKLLLRLYDWEGGAYLINGEPAHSYDVHALRSCIGIAFQQPNIYALPLRENLCVYHDAADETLRRILEEVRLPELLQGEAPLDAQVTREFDENGRMLSGGQAQKLALARLLTGEFGLVLLDEPSSALDPLAEYELAKLMFGSANATTTIMIAHRLSTVRSADRIYLVANGGVAEQGTHEELMALGGKYAEMFNKQAENYVAK